MFERVTEDYLATTCVQKCIVGCGAAEPPPTPLAEAQHPLFAAHGHEETASGQFVAERPTPIANPSTDGPTADISQKSLQLNAAADYVRSNSNCSKRLDANTAHLQPSAELQSNTVPNSNTGR